MEVVAKSWAVTELVKQRRIYGKECVTLDYLTSAQIRSGLTNRDSLVKFLEGELGYKTNPVFYEVADLGITPYLTRQVDSWWLLSHYPGRLPFQIHFVEITELPGFNLCRDILDSFRRRRPGYFLFLFTKDYCHMLFITVELSLERRPYTWQLLPKSYFRFLLTDCANPTSTDLNILTKLQVEPSESDAGTLHKKVLEALKPSGYYSELPDWFWSPWYYRLGYSQDIYEKLREQGKI